MCKKRTNKDIQKKKNIFTLITKRIKTAHTVISDDRNRVKSRRINYAKIISIYLCVQKKKKATFIHISRDKDADVLRSTCVHRKKEIIYKSRFSWMNFARKKRKKINAL